MQAPMFMGSSQRRIRMAKRNFVSPVLAAWLVLAGTAWALAADAEPQAKPPETAAPESAAPAMPPAAEPQAKPANATASEGPAKDETQAAPPAQSPPAAAESQPKPAPESQLITLPKLSAMEVDELGDRLALHFESMLGYEAVSADLMDTLIAPPTRITGLRTIARPTEAGMHVLCFGYRHFITQPPQFWVFGAVVEENNTLTANPDLALVEPEVTQMIAALSQMREGLTVRDLEAKLIQLSYVDTDAALTTLKGLGVTTMGAATEVPAKVEFANLPYVVKVADPAKDYTGLIGEKTSIAKSKLSLSPGVASALSDNAIASPLTQLLVLFHPAHPGQFSEVRRILDELVDRPARQIFIEGMVLEISEEGLKELGVEWELDDPLLNITAGALNAGSTVSSLDVTVPDTHRMHNIFKGDVHWDWNLAIRALVREGKAEILSRPSILTLDNRQCTIRVGQDIPIASSLEGMTSYTNRVSFSFEYLPTGILLNIRPRINEDGTEVTILVDTMVSATVPGADLEMRAPDNVVLASAPTISTRRVQTYSRIPNNTPLIIGGLVSSETISTKDKIPVLGDLPLVGIAFRGTSEKKAKREVIIVLTPHVLPERREVRRSFPKDEDNFDSFGNELYRDSYRIRSEDVFDLTFLLENRRIVSYRRMARQAAARNFRLGEVEPFRSFVQDRIPGESILVTRMIYEVIKRLDIAAPIQPSKIIYFESQEVGGYNVHFLDERIKDGGKAGVKDFGDQALAMTYTYDRESLEQGRLGSEPIPDIRLVDCPDRDAWGALLWELNQPTPEGQHRHTILIQNESDLLRLRRALALKRIVVLNGGDEHLRLRNFSVGKTLLMPELKDEQIHVIDADTARFFFHTEHYYAAALAEIEKRLNELDEMLKRPDIQVLLDVGVDETQASRSDE